MHTTARSKVRLNSLRNSSSSTLTLGTKIGLAFCVIVAYVYVCPIYWLESVLVVEYWSSCLTSFSCAISFISAALSSHCISFLLFALSGLL